MSVLTHIFLNVRSLAEDRPSSAAWRSRGGCGPVPRSLAGESSRCLSKGRSDSSLRGRPQEGCSMTLSCVACALRTDAAQTAQFHHLETKLRRVAGPCGGRHRPPPGGRGPVGSPGCPSSSSSDPVEHWMWTSTWLGPNPLRAAERPVCGRLCPRMPPRAPSGLGWLSILSPTGPCVAPHCAVLHTWGWAESIVQWFSNFSRLIMECPKSPQSAPAGQSRETEDGGN